MEKRIELEKRGNSPGKIKDLILDNCRSTSIVGLTDEFVILESLSLINVGLTSLKGFPKLPKLKKLELSDNRISNGLNVLHKSPLLTSVNLSNNRIKDFDVLQPLRELKKLTNLDLFNNDVTCLQNYRETIFCLIPSLKFLDGFDKDNKEADDSDDDEVNGNDDWTEEEDDSEQEDDLGLDAIYQDNLEDESDDEYEEEEEEEEDEEGSDRPYTLNENKGGRIDDDFTLPLDEFVPDEEDYEYTYEDEAEEEASPRGKKRKLEDGGKKDEGAKKSNGPAE